MNESEIFRITPEPTSARPGSEEKIEVLRRRWESNSEMHVAGDAKRQQPAEMSSYLRFLHNNTCNIRVIRTVHRGRDRFIVGGQL